jgi:hypothetical protein
MFAMSFDLGRNEIVLDDSLPLPFREKFNAFRQRIFSKS